MRISDWSSDVCSSDLQVKRPSNVQTGLSTSVAQDFANEVSTVLRAWRFPGECQTFFDIEGDFDLIIDGKRRRNNGKGVRAITHAAFKVALLTRSEEHTSELQSLMRISYAVFCLKKNTTHIQDTH